MNGKKHSLVVTLVLFLVSITAIEPVFADFVEETGLCLIDGTCWTAKQVADTHWWSPLKPYKFWWQATSRDRYGYPSDIYYISARGRVWKVNLDGSIGSLLFDGSDPNYHSADSYVEYNQGQQCWYAKGNYHFIDYSGYGWAPQLEDTFCYIEN